jgi:hypothetical protein
MTSSLKMLLPKSALACNIISKGSKLGFQEMARRFQQDILKGHWKKR